MFMMAAGLNSVFRLIGRTFVPIRVNVSKDYIKKPAFIRLFYYSFIIIAFLERNLILMILNKKLVQLPYEQYIYIDIFIMGILNCFLDFQIEIIYLYAEISYLISNSVASMSSKKN